MKEQMNSAFKYFSLPIPDFFFQKGLIIGYIIKDMKNG